ncbi:sensor histidine kinase [Methylocystis parvus]|uniref:Signal transduction histidine kinase subgroup 3 dimerisation and phosphoacceptor domain-containing protein n=1 Tax=Methylocystis parvus TaxID=134 RepID=A0A6B8M9F6_9HYPH|nr:histidine kinase [Methylocystis parvus]QGM99045.1 hypothetical protein F7D14_17185 [Methylocystis parvus]WBK00588.1 histidine kinase [Methylocystis parvus OBBP]
MAEAVAAERGRLAMDLHDGVLQSLAAARYRLHEAQTEQGEPRTAAIDCAVDIIAREQRALRAFIEAAAQGAQEKRESAALPPSAIIEDARRIAEAWGCAIETSCNSAHLSVSSRCVEQIGFLMREAISNAVRHAGAKALAIEVARHPGLIRIEMTERRAAPSEIVDFTPRSLTARVAALNGSMSIVSSAQEITLAFAIPTHDGG